ncbi:DMT family transporter [Bacillus altitudinis]|uniref:DMT family transporter n=1 Tax=Bacillus TaxID=1386 RepID=UPI002247D33D|nr:DMT family transporter [Bacillus altitudinis]MCA1017783.1 DMT family transporter [Bacillus stratosphericus]KAJ0071361.1 DMT family transporter [Bacillus altitudinis]MCY7497947.1 DMT family transporter [Bacillus altitudinis]MCY7537498.1 DMT family transporter [Bacillus altitudinis]MCY7548714.1 DMT family transporter [Bacillus altitudinis]
MEMKTNSPKKSIAVPLVISIIAISFSAIIVKWSSAPAAILSMYRMIFAAVLMLPFILPRQKELVSLKRRDWFFLCMSGFFLGLHFVLWFGSLKLTTVASSTIIIALQPMVSLLGGFLIFRERTTKSAIFTMCAAIVGALMIGWGDIGHNQDAIIGDILSFFSVIAVVCYLLIGQQAVRKISHWIYSFCVFGFAGLFLILFNLIQQTPFVGYSGKEWGIFLLLAIIPTMSHVINNWLLTYVNATTISMSILGEPVGATILAVLLLGEKVTLLQMFGGLLVLLGVFFFLMQQRQGIVMKTKKSG